MNYDPTDSNNSIIIGVSPGNGSDLALELSGHFDDASDLAYDTPRVEVRLNYWVAVFTMIAVLIVLVAINYIHSKNVGGYISVLKLRAEESQSEDDFNGAFRLYRQYLGFRPDDLDASIELARVAREISKERYRDPRLAIRIYEKILRDNPGFDRAGEIRLELVEQLLEAGWNTAAKEHLKILLRNDPENAQLHAKDGYCLEELDRYTKAEAAYREAIRLEPSNFEYRFALCRMLIEELERTKDAKGIMDQLVLDYPNSGQAFAIRGQLRLLLGQRQAALFDARTAYRLAPDARDTVLLISELMSIEDVQGEVLTWFDVNTIRQKVVSLQIANEDRNKQVSYVLALTKLDIADNQQDVAIKRLRDGLKRHPERFDLVWLMVDILTVQKRYDEALKEIEKLRRLRVRPEIPDYLEARVLMGQKKWEAAARLLESLSAVPGSPAFLSDVNFNLGKTQAELKLHRPALAAFREALLVNPTMIDAQVAMCQQLVILNRFQEAIDGYSPLANSPSGSLAIARLQLRQELRNAPENRQWDRVESAINRAAFQNDTSLDVELLRLDLLAAKGQLDDAAEFLGKLMSEHAEESRLAFAQARLSDLRGNSDDALNRYEQIEEKHGLSLELVLSLIAHHAARIDEKGLDPIKQLRETALQLPEPQRWEALKSIASTFQRAGEFSEAIRDWETIAQNSDSIEAWRAILRIMILQGDIPEKGEPKKSDEILSHIQRIEGQKGSEWLLSRAAILAATQESAALNRSQIQELLEDAVKDSSRSLLIRREAGIIAQQAGLLDDAILYYGQVIESNYAMDVDLIILRRLVDILTNQRRYREAYQFLRQCLSNDRLNISDNLKKQAASIALLSESRSESLTLARSVFRESSDDFKDHLWYARMLAAANDSRTAGKYFKKATQLAPQEYVVWLEYIRFLNDTGQVAEVESILKEAQQNIPKSDLDRMLAICHDVLGNYNLSIKHSRDAVQANPEDLVILNEHAALLVKLRLNQEAEQILRRLIEIAPDSTLRRSSERMLANVLSRKGDYRSFLEAKKIVEEGRPKNRSVNFQDDLALAQVLAVAPFRDAKLEAATIFKRLSRDGFEFPPHMRMLMIQVYLDLDRWEDAFSNFNPILGMDKPNPAYLVKCISDLLEHGESGESVEEWMVQLKKALPKAEATIELSAWLEIANGSLQMSVQVVNQWALEKDLDEKQSKLRRLLAARIFDRLAQRSKKIGRSVEASRLESIAENRYRANIEERIGDQTPELAMLVVRMGRYKEVIALLENAPSEIVPLRLGRIYLAMVKAGGLPISVSEKINTWRSRLVFQSDSLPLRILAADLAHSLEDYPNALKLYREALEQSPNSIHALNEYAYLNALRGSVVDANRSIDKAIEEYGPRGYLLDTKALVLLRINKPKEALKVAEQAFADQPDPAHSLRKVQALLEVGDEDGATSTWKSALAQGLYKDGLHPLERDLFSEFQKRFQRR